MGGGIERACAVPELHMQPGESDDATDAKAES